ncbi:hypothetical protein [Hymenobacter psychrotolerans]|uniref:Secreted protein n=1 Tax=Hymenobacter psychrotolerans DSM 18569 TaxID=1121959 RepID=A0A1M7AGT6_9BACT|nr:hypothetical protein [Hymenobacter psychrotolerans]SHL41699.1 hypothetical protein SAMN02746009_02714 [Hymenobacter psychrotolerans DSM 18569]
MKSFFLSAFLLVVSASASFAQTQYSVAADSWLEEPAAADEAPRYNMGWNTAPGQSLSLHDRPSTDYWGRPLKKKSANLTTAATKVVAYVEEESTDPMMKSSGVMVAPGMSSSPYRRVSTDYWGRPLKQKSKTSSSLAKTVEQSEPVASTTASNW